MFNQKRVFDKVYIARLFQESLGLSYLVLRIGFSRNSSLKSSCDPGQNRLRLSLLSKWPLPGHYYWTMARLTRI